MFNPVEWIGDHMILVTGIVVVLSYLYTFVKSKDDYFKNRNIPYIPFAQCVKDTFARLSRKRQMGSQLIKYYNGFPSRSFVGLYARGVRAIMIKDLDVIRRVLIKDFDHFVDRSAIDVSKIEPMASKMLTSLTGHQWKNVRSAVSPTFTSKKIKIMSELVVNTVKSLNVLLRKKADNEEEIDIQDLFTNTATDAIAASIFGLDCKCLEGNTAFKEMVGKLTDFKVLRVVPWLISPKLAQFFGIHLMDPIVVKYFQNMIDQAVEGRKKQNVVGNDFLQQIVDTKENSIDAQEDINEDEDARLNHKANVKEGKE